jgi:glyoxylase-like metal-dependent hydrolase (beta-lactamase superfamily II)
MIWEGLSMATHEDKFAELLAIPTLDDGEFDEVVTQQLEPVSKRQRGEALRQLAEAEAQWRCSRDEMLTPQSLKQLQIERLSRIKTILSRLLGSEFSQVEYDRLLARISKKIDWIIRTTLRLAHLPIPFVKIRQEAVGHGGFHHGVLATHDYQTRWVYDCGSWHKLGRQSLEKCIQKFVGECARDNRLGSGHLELLVVSHFDADHVSGLRRLLNALPGKTGTVVLPYLGSLGAFVVLCEAATRGRCPPDLVRQVVDPVGWFQDFGVLRVVQIRPGRPKPPPGGGDVRPPPDLPLPRDVIPPELAHDLFSLGLLGPDRKAIRTKSAQKNGVDCQAAIAAAGTVMPIATPLREAWTDWWFVPYAHPISSKTRKALRAEAKRIVGVSTAHRNFNERLARLLSRKSGVKKLKEAYRRAGMKDANSISLSLYAGPRPSRKKQRTLRDEDKKPSGWLLTGDAILKEKSGYPSWISFFKPLQNSVGMLMLPHHGSSENFCDAILHDVPLADLFVTADGKDKTRPNKRIRDAAKLGRRRIRKVSELHRNGITEISGPCDLTTDDYPYANEW